MVGTTGAMRAVIEAPQIEMAPGLWCYRLDRRRLVMGGSLLNGGEVYAWMHRTLALPDDVEKRLASAVPGSHGLTMLPFFSGERSPYWRADLRGAVTGLSLSTGPFDILQAALESVSLLFRQIYELLAGRLGTPSEVIASGGGLLESPAWTQIMADALQRPLIASTEEEPSSRGAALWVLEQLGAVAKLSDAHASTGAAFSPRPAYAPAYDKLLAEQNRTYERLFEDTVKPASSPSLPK
jgi:gluconokinase